MDKPFLIIITGPPGAGKTILGKQLSRDLMLPFICKDDIKEILFDTLGWGSRQQSMELGQTSFEILFHFLERLLERGKSAIVETAFIPKYHNARFLTLQDNYRFESIQILCHTDENELYERFIRRAQSSDRHPGHVDHLLTYDQFVRQLHERKYDALAVDGALLRIDMRDFNEMSYKEIVERINSLGINRT